MSILGNIAELAAAIRNLAAAIRQQHGLPQPGDPAKPEGTVGYYSVEEAREQAIEELVHELRGAPRAQQEEVMRQFGFGE